MFISYTELKKMCNDFPNEFNRGYLLALFHNSLIRVETFNELNDVIENSEHYKEYQTPIQS